MNNEKVVAGYLLILAVSLLLVGIISDMLLRHVVQIVPVLAALGLLLKRPASGAYIALPVFGFWLFIMALIWLYLLGISDLAEGSYTTPEIVLTVIIAGCSALGILKSVQVKHTLSPLHRTILILVGLAGQVAFMAVSFQPAFANA